MTGKIIQARRKELGMTQGDLAQRVGVNWVQVSRWERGAVKNFRLEMAAKVAAVLGLNLADLQVKGAKATTASAGESLEETVANLREAHRLTKGSGARWSAIVAV